MGTSYRNHITDAIGQDHPHAYGDKLKPGEKIFFRKGSSPRVWGQVSPIALWTDDDRIIPTRMGTSSVDEVHRYVV